MEKGEVMDEVMDAVYGEIYSTKDYSQFKLIRGNRKISTNLNLEKLIQKSGVLRPIVVNKEMEILDGQHRYAIAKKYKLELPYYISPSKSVEDIIILNTSSKRWQAEDYIQKYKEDGLRDYILLDRILKEYIKIPLTDICYCAQGYFKKKGKLMEKVKDGQFKFIDSDGFIECLIDFQKFIYVTGIHPIKGVFSAFFGLYIVEKFNLEHFISKVNSQDLKTKIVGINNEKLLLKRFVKDAYNFNVKKTSDKYINFKFNNDNEKSIYILEKLKKHLIHPKFNDRIY